MIKLEKTAVLPVVSLVAIGVQVIFHEEIPAGVQDSVATLIVDAVAVVGLIYGIIKNHQKA